MCFYDSLFLSFFHLQRCFFFMLFLQQEKAAKAEKNDHKNGILNHKNQRNQSWAASSKSFLSRTLIGLPCVGQECRFWYGE